MAQRRALAACENYRKTLDTFSFEELNASQQVTYAIFKDWLDTELSGADFLLYEEPLGPALGISGTAPGPSCRIFPFCTKAVLKIISHC